MQKIPMVDLRGQYDKIQKEIDEAVISVIRSTAFINGGAVKEFATDLEQYLDINHVIPCGNGTDALQIALMALGLKPGDEVITPSFTYIATVEVMALLGLYPKFVEVNPTTFNMDVASLEKAITPKTKAIVPVHLYGQCADMEAILAVAEKHTIPVVEDTAQALGAEYTFSDGTTKKAGTMGTIGCTSFFPSKNLGCYGDGGAIFTNDADLAQKLKITANHGQTVKYHHDLIGVNSRLDTIQAAILKVKLPHLDEYATARGVAAKYYTERLSKMEGITTPTVIKNSTHVYHQYTIKLDGIEQSDLQTKLNESGIPASVYYPIPVHQQKGYAAYQAGQQELSNTENLCKTVLSLPIHTEMTTEQLDYICSTIENILK